MNNSIRKRPSTEVEESANDEFRESVTTMNKLTIKQCSVQLIPLQETMHKELYEEQIKFHDFEDSDTIVTSFKSDVHNLNIDRMMVDNKPTIRYVDIDKIIKQPPVETQKHAIRVSRRLLQANKKLYFNKHGKRIAPKSDVSQTAIQLQRLDLSRFNKIDNVTYSVTKGQLRKGQLKPTSNKQFYIQIPKKIPNAYKQNRKTIISPIKYNSSQQLESGMKRNLNVSLRNSLTHIEDNNLYEKDQFKRNVDNSACRNESEFKNRKEKSTSRPKTSRKSIFQDKRSDSLKPKITTNLSETSKQKCSPKQANSAKKQIFKPGNKNNKTHVVKPGVNNKSVRENKRKLKTKHYSYKRENDVLPKINSSRSQLSNKIPSPNIQCNEPLSPIEKHYKLVFDNIGYSHIRDPYERKQNERFNFNDTVLKLCNNKRVLRLPNSQWKFESNKPCNKKENGKNVTVSYTVANKSFTKSLYFDIKSTVEDKLTFYDVYALKYFSFKRYQFQIKSMNVFRVANRIIDIYRDGTYRINVDNSLIELCGAPTTVKNFSEIQILLNIVNDFTLCDNYISVNESANIP